MTTFKLVLSREGRWLSPQVRKGMRWEEKERERRLGGQPEGIGLALEG